MTFSSDWDMQMNNSNLRGKPTWEQSLLAVFCFIAVHSFVTKNAKTKKSTKNAKQSLTASHIVSD